MGYGFTALGVSGIIALDRQDFADRMRPAAPTTLRRVAGPRALILCALLGGALLPMAVSTAQAATEKLTLENASPLPVPPRPALASQKTIKAPPRFVTPTVLDTPPLPDLVEGPSQPAARAKAAPVAAPAPSAPLVAARPAPATPPPTITAPAQGAPASVAPAPVPPTPARTETASLPPPPNAAPPAVSATPTALLTLVFDGAAANLPDAVEFDG